MTDFALPIGPVLEVDMKAAIGELDRLAADVDREDYFFNDGVWGGVWWQVYVWFEGKVPIYVGVSDGPERYLEHWTKAASGGLEFAAFLAEHKTTMWPAFAASNVSSAVAHSLERLLIKTYRRRKDGGTLFNRNRGKLAGRSARGEDTFGLKRPAERAPVPLSYLSKFQANNRPYACWQTAKAQGVVVPDDYALSVLIGHNPKVGLTHEQQFNLYAGISNVGAYRSVCSKAGIQGVNDDLLWDSCCQHKEGPYIALSSPEGSSDRFRRQCLFPRDHC